MLEYFNIGFRAESTVKEFQRNTPRENYNKFILDDALLILDNSKKALTKKGYKEKLVPYYDIFLYPLENKKDLGRVLDESDMANKTIKILKKIKSSKPVKKEELDMVKNFFTIISDRCLSLQNYYNDHPNEIPLFAKSLQQYL